LPRYRQARDEIERLIRFLDETDNYIELEPDGDEDEDGDSAEFDIPDEASELPPVCRVRGGGITLELAGAKYHSGHVELSCQSGVKESALASRRGPRNSHRDSTDQSPST
jgi:hypothetical protein